MKLPDVGFSEIILVVIYIIATQYFVRSRVREEFKETDERLDNLEYYLRRVEALAAYLQTLVERNNSILEKSTKVREIIDKIKETDFDNKE